MDFFIDLFKPYNNITNLNVDNMGLIDTAEKIKPTQLKAIKNQISILDDKICSGINKLKLKS